MKRTLGEFFKERAQDTPDNPFDPAKSPIDTITPNPTLVLSQPAILPSQPAPVLSQPAKLPMQPAPVLSQPAKLPMQPAPMLSTPATLLSQPAPKLSVPAVIPQQPAPQLSTPAVIPTQPAPTLSTPAVLPSQPAPVLSTPAVLPDQPAPTLSTPVVLPAQPAPVLSIPAVLPDQPAPKLSVPAVLPDQPTPMLSSPAVLPVQPAPKLSVPGTLPAQPAPALSVPATLPAQPAPALSTPAVLPSQPAPALSVPATLPAQPAPPLSTPATLPAQPPPPLSTPATLPAQPAPPLSTPATLPAQPPPALSSPATLPMQPPPPLTSTSSLPPPPNVTITPLMYPLPVMVPPPYPNGPAQNNFTEFAPGGQLNVIPDPMKMVDDTVLSFFQVIDQVAGLSPLDLVIDQDTANVSAVLGNLATAQLMNLYSDTTPYKQNAVMKIGDLVDDIIAGQNRLGVIQDDPMDSTGMKRVAFAIGGTLAPGTFNGVPGPFGIVRLFTGDALQLASPTQWDTLPGLAAATGRSFGSKQLEKSAFSNGLIPARFRADNVNGFMTFTRGAAGKMPVGDDEAYVPVSFTDLRPVGQVYRTVYFRPLNVKLAESFSPSWNKAQYLGRVDTVATYQATGRTINLSFFMAAFGPEDVQTIWNKIIWLQSMVYPEYDSDLQYYSGPIVRLRVGDVINAVGPEGGLGLPGIIDSLDFDYGDSIWELKKDYKVPRNIQVNVTFTVLHDMPIGRGAEGKFGGIGSFDQDGNYQPPSQNQTPPSPGNDSTALLPDVSYGTAAVRRVGQDNANTYDTLGGSDGLAVQLPIKG
jgi:hypothetical protein